MNFKKHYLIFLLSIFAVVPLTTSCRQEPTKDVRRIHRITVIEGETFEIKTPPTGFLPIIWACKTDTLPDNIKLINTTFSRQYPPFITYTFQAVKKGIITLVCEGHWAGMNKLIDSFDYEITINQRNLSTQ